MEARDHIKSVLAALGDYYELYLVAHNMTIMKQANEDSIVVASSNVSSRDVGPKVATSTSRFLDHVRSIEIIRPLKTYLDIYLEEDVFILEKDGNGIDIDLEFEALAWWKANNLKYCILSKMARDILVILMSSVVSESTFIAGCRVIEPHRASLSPKTIQMLLCGSVIVPKIILASVRIVCSKVCIKLRGRSTGKMCFCIKLIYSNLIDLF